MLTKEELEASKGATGRIVRIVGPVVDVEFPPDQLPAIYNALTVDAKTLAGDLHLVLEVETHLPGNLVRSVAMSSTDGLVRGLEVVDTGNPIMMPVGPETLGRIWNVMGEPVDKKPMPDVKDYRRTLYWTPKVKFNDKGEAVIQLYNNSKKTVITVEAEGITTDGKPVVWKSETDKTYSR